MEIYETGKEYAVEFRWQGKLVELSATKRTTKEEARFEIFIYHRPEAQITPSAQVSFSETSVVPLIYLITHHQNIDILTETGKRLTWQANNQMLAIYNDPQQKKPSAWARLPLLSECLSQENIRAGFFKALGLKVPALV